MPSALDDHELFPAPFPTDIASISLQRVSAKKLITGDEDEIAALFDVCASQGAFYLDLTGDARSLEFLNESQQLHRIAVDVFKNVPMNTKQTFRATDAVGHMESGYKCLSVDNSGQPDKSEFVTISHYGLLCQPKHYHLPPWLSEHEHLYRSFMQHGNMITNMIFTVFERQLHLSPGALTALHQTKDASGDFLRLFRYPAPTDGLPRPEPPAPAHTDSMSLTILFNWQGGLQVTRTPTKLRQQCKVNMEDFDKPDDDWLFVVPVPDCAIIIVGDPMAVFSNGLLKACRHRVVTPPGAQGKFHRYSVLTTARPANDTPMQALQSDVIPPLTPKQSAEVPFTAIQWSMAKVRGILNRVEQQSVPPLGTIGTSVAA